MFFRGDDQDTFFYIQVFRAVELQFIVIGAGVPDVPLGKVPREILFKCFTVAIAGQLLFVQVIPAFVEQRVCGFFRLLQRLGNGQPRADAPPLAWITASNGRDTVLIMLEDVVYFRADNKYTTVVTAAGESLLRTPLRELLEVLDPLHFRQVHRSTIVNMKAVAAVSRDDTGRGVLRLRQRAETLVVSQPFMSLFRGM